MKGATMRTTQTRTLIIFLLIIGVACSACSKADVNSSSGGDAQKTQQSANLNQMNPQPRDKVQQGGKLTWPIDGVPANFNYGEIDGTNREGSFILWAVLPMLFHFDAAGTPSYNPDCL